ncbi:MAG: Gfo/Idh/MocA family oxidoreductase [candidate division KSB1 bacterium]|nr:Gfo/Idh/MocA family oxidoreductase [candidate division KSB1 bacterium]MDZ7345471.1 Gfo/Idh/MocA family oxidoreductase [candidate division KSB1 bacterium]
MIRFAIVGYGFIGGVHAAVLRKIKGAEVAAIVEQDTAKRQAVKGNITVEGAEEPLQVPFYASLEEVFEKTKVDVVSICLPTHLHRDYAVKSLKAGCHVVCEKPMALTLKDCDEMIVAARAARRRLFIAQCIRFWPEYEALEKIVRENQLGALLSLRLFRLSGMPNWGGPNAWFFDEQKSGGCLFDLHVHDADYVHYLLGRPVSVLSRGVSLPNGTNGAVTTTYLFDRDLICTAEGSWLYRSGFRMGFSAIFEEGQIEYDSAAVPAMRLWRKGSAEAEIILPEPGDGYERQYRYFIHCLEQNLEPTRMTPESARQSIEIALAEKRSMEEARLISLRE